MGEQMKHISREKIKISHLTAIAVIIIGAALSIGSYIWVTKENSKIHMVEVKASRGITIPDTTKMMDVDFEIPVRDNGAFNTWPESDGTWGGQYDIFIYNNSRHPIKNWHLKIKKPAKCRIDSSWNGTFSIDNEYINVTPLSIAMNQTVLPGDKVRIGFVLYTQKILNSMDFSLEANTIHVLWKFHGWLVGITLFLLGLVTYVIVIIVDHLLKKQEKLADEKIEMLMEMCAKFIDIRDIYTKRHSSHVADYSRKIAKEMGFNETFQKNIYCYGMLHDTGKVLIPREILCKNGKLTPEEWNEMKNHTIYGSNLLEDFEGYSNLKKVALHHHERYDGNGYPEGLSGEAIPIEARIVCVADSYDAMNTNRSYRQKLPREKILEELENNRGTQFDPKVADAMIALIKRGEI